MWPKEDYQEHMLGYLDGLRLEFEQVVRSHIQQHNFNAFYADLDSTLEYLWRLIGASDTDWEWYRYPLEASCDELLHTIRQLPDDILFHPISSFMLMGVRVVQIGTEPEMVSSNAN